MDVDEWWPRLDDQTRRWLVDHNGEVLPDEVVHAVERAGGPGASGAGWSWDDDAGGRVLDDDVVDRIEALANDEP